jgi:ribonuclease Z
MLKPARSRAYIALSVAALALILTIGAPAQQMIVTLIGTGGPELTADRAGEATLIQANHQSLLFDAGRGVLDNLNRSHIPPQSVTKIFLTHLHSDHIAGLPDLWITPWFLLGRTTPLEIWGPTGTQAMIEGMRAMYAHDLEHRPNAALLRKSLHIIVHEIQPGTVYQSNGITVTATAVEHADGDPAFAYRIEAAGHIIFLTGDCTLTSALLNAAASISPDLLIANVAAGTPQHESDVRWKPVFAKLLTPEQDAQLFTAAKPRLAVFSHIVKKALPGSAGDAVIIARTRRAGYRGRLLMGHDRTRIIIGKTTTVSSIVGPVPELDGTSSH